MEYILLNLISSSNSEFSIQTHVTTTCTYITERCNIVLVTGHILGITLPTKSI